MLSATTASLAPFPDDWQPSLVDVLAFLEARSKYADPPLPRGHWLLQFRNACLSLGSLFVELAVWHTLSKQEPGAAPPVAVVMGKSGKRQARLGTMSKLQWLGKLADRQGSPDTILATLSSSKGYAAVIRNVRNRLYNEEAAKIFRWGICCQHELGWCDLQWPQCEYCDLLETYSKPLGMNKSNFFQRTVSQQKIFTVSEANPE